MEYKEIFSERAQSFYDTITKYPNVMDQEHKCYLENIPKITDGVYLELSPTFKPIPWGTQIQVENSREFAALFKLPFIEDYSQMNYKDNIFDSVCAIAALHHYLPHSRKNIYKELYRILKPNGSICIADVMKNSLPDKFLNVFVDKYSSSGHDGYFFNRDDIDNLKEIGFEVHYKLEKYFWDFESWEHCFTYTKSLFHLIKYDKSLDEFKKEIQEYLPIIEHPNKTISWKWELLYIHASLPK